VSVVVKNRCVWFSPSLLPSLHAGDHQAVLWLPACNITNHFSHPNICNHFIALYAVRLSDADVSVVKFVCLFRLHGVLMATKCGQTRTCQKGARCNLNSLLMWISGVIFTIAAGTSNIGGKIVCAPRMPPSVPWKYAAPRSSYITCALIHYLHKLCLMFSIVKVRGGFVMPCVANKTLLRGVRDARVTPS
jgi:hypothetical protein